MKVVRQRAEVARTLGAARDILKEFSLHPKGQLDELKADPFEAIPYDAFHALVIGLITHVFSMFALSLEREAMTALNLQLKNIKPIFWTAIAGLN
jgi:hypothetical protein